MAAAGIKIICPICGTKWLICKNCYRGHKYCSEVCKKKGFSEKRKTAQKKYSQSKKGRLKQSKRQLKYRLNKKKRHANRIKSKKKKVTDKSINKFKTIVSIIKKENCWICGDKISNIYDENSKKEYLMETHYHKKR